MAEKYFEGFSDFPLAARRSGRFTKKNWPIRDEVMRE
jgi:hypothetical protein